MSLGDTERKVLERLRADFPMFARQLLKVKGKDSTIQSFRLNTAQLHVHKMLDRQRQETGKVRALVLKGRQQGISTYITGRHFHRVSHFPGTSAFVLAHEQAASDNLFAMVDRYHANLPEWYGPKVGQSNAKTLSFVELDSSFSVGTAGSKDTGRSKTAQLLHGSEVAFWDNADAHLMGLGQIVPDLPGTEIILESTANGVGNVFHRLWMDAETGASDFLPVFIPWFWSPEYRRPLPQGWKRTEEEDAYAIAHGVDDEQLAWRRNKIATDFLGDSARFSQEYPATAAEAFVAVGHDPLIQPAWVLSARVGTPKEGGPLIVGVDPARFGSDATAIVRRRGRVILDKMDLIRKQDTMSVAGRIAVLIRDERPARVFIDIGGLGAGVYDRLVELHHGDVVSPVNFGGTADQDERYVNKRSEMWAELRDWLRQPPVRVPKSDLLLGELTGPKYAYDSSGRLKLESKDEMAKRGVKSPNLGDAAALTFAAPVAVAAMSDAPWDQLMQAMSEVENDNWETRGFHTG